MVDVSARQRDRAIVRGAVKAEPLSSGALTAPVRDGAALRGRDEGKRVARGRTKEMAGKG